MDALLQYFKFKLKNGDGQGKGRELFKKNQKLLSCLETGFSVQ
jgi:hypothetical protein